MQQLLSREAQGATHHDLFVLGQNLYLQLRPVPPALPEQAALDGDTVRASAGLQHELRRVRSLAQFKFHLAWV